MDLSGLVDEKFFMPRLMALADCLCDELAKAGGPSLCFCGLVPAGRPPLGLMNCASGDCGVAWISPIGTFPYSIFPQQAEPTASKCAIPLAMRVQIGVARCFPRPRTGKTQPDPQDTFDAMRLYLSDMAALKRAALCCFPEGNRDWMVALESWEPIEPQGSASGGVWTAVIG